jgi:hypothetical protein
MTPTNELQNRERQKKDSKYPRLADGMFGWRLVAGRVPNQVAQVRLVSPHPVAIKNHLISRGCDSLERHSALKRAGEQALIEQTALLSVSFF